MPINASGRCYVAAAALLVTVLEVRVAVAQSLGDIARAEAERRKQVTTGRAYTNDDLSTEPRAEGQPAPQPPALAPAPADSKTENSAGFVTKEDPATGIVDVKSATQARPKRDEQYWRGRVKDIRARQAKLQAELATTEQRLAAIDAAPQTPLSARERELTATAVERLRANARLADQEMTQLKTMAESARIPMEWIR